MHKGAIIYSSIVSQGFELVTFFYNDSPTNALF